MLILPSRFCQQPQGPVGIDKGHPLAQQLSFAFNAGAGVRDAVTGIMGSQNAGSGSIAQTVASLGGTARKYTTASQNPDYWPNISNAAGPKSMAVLASWAATPGLDATFMKGGFNNGWGFKANSSGQMRLIGNSSSLADTVAIAANTLYLFFGAFDTVTETARFHKNGALIGSFGSTGGVQSTSGLNLLIGKDESVAAGSAAYVYGAWVWERAFTQSEVIQFSANPWQIYKPASRRIWVSVPVSGVSGSIAWTEDADTASLAGNVSITGSAAWTEANDSFGAAGVLALSGVIAWTESNDQAALFGIVGNVPVPTARILTIAPERRVLSVNPENRVLGI